MLQCLLTNFLVEAGMTASLVAGFKLLRARTSFADITRTPLVCEGSDTSIRDFEIFGLLEGFQDFNRDLKISRFQQRFPGFMMISGFHRRFQDFRRDFQRNRHHWIRTESESEPASWLTVSQALARRIRRHSIELRQGGDQPYRGPRVPGWKASGTISS